MGNNKKEEQTRRRFLSLFLNKKEKEETIKLLTADGKLVEVNRSVVEQANRQKATKKDIYEWMDNPSKKTTD